METLIDMPGLHDGQAHFRATQGGAELDLPITRGAARIGVEIKRTTAPRVTRSTRIAPDDLALP